MIKRFVLCLWAFVILGVLPALAQTAPDPKLVGSWGPLIEFPYRPIHATLLPSGKVLFYSYYSESYYPQIWDPIANTTAPAAKSDYQLFCNGHTLLADGTVFMAGGHLADYVGTNTASIYDPEKDSWTQLPNLSSARWYPTTTRLSNGDVLVLSGSKDASQDFETLPQVWERATNSWRDLTTAQLWLPLYPKMFVAPNGKLFYAGPERVSRWLDPNGTGTWTQAAVTNSPNWRDYGAAAMYGIGQIVIIGGNNPPHLTSETIDLTSTTPKWVWSGSMAQPRRHHFATTLPDGTVLVTGGSAGSAKWDDESKPVKYAELWDPSTGKFTVLASEQNYRGYHGVALLLPDGRVLSAGSNKGGPNGQVFSPPYLFRGARPTVTAAPGALAYAERFVVETPDAAGVAKVTLIALGSVTHTFNFNSHFVPLGFEAENGQLRVTAPANENLAPPGHYMLFLVDRAGVPSVARIVAVGAGGASAGPPPPAETAPIPGSVKGRVSDAGSGTPLAAATVTLGGKSASTGQDGSYRFEEVQPSTYNVTAQAAGYMPATGAVTVTEGSEATLDLALSTGGQVAGKVTNISNGSALAGATVVLGSLSTFTSTAGAYLFSNVMPGSYRMTFKANGYLPREADIVLPSGGSITQDMPLATAGQIAGKVMTAAGAPIANATVQISGGIIATNITLKTNSTGNYISNWIPVGSYIVKASVGTKTAQQSASVTAGATSTRNFTF